MNKKILITTLVIVIVVLTGTTIYFANSQKLSAPTTNETTKPEESITSTSNEVAISEENWTNTPAEIKNLTTKNGFNYLFLDLLTRNSNFQPGVTNFFINQVTKLREVKVDDNFKFYKCGSGSDNNDTTADVRSSTKELIAYIQKKMAEKDPPLIYYFDVEEGVVKSIYEQCLP